MKSFISRKACLLGFALAASCVAIPVSFAQQPQTVRLRGTITAVDGSLVSAKLRNGTEVKIHLSDTARLIAVVKASLSDVTPGTYIGIVSFPQPDGSNKASEIHIFPENLRGAGEGQRPWDQGPGSKMTNATLATKAGALDGQMLTVTFAGGEAKIATSPETEVVRFAPGEKSDLKPGNQFVVVAATKAGEDLFDAAGINVGRDGLKPPM